MRFCSRLPYPTAPRCDANGCYTEIRIECRPCGYHHHAYSLRRYLGKLCPLRQAYDD